MGSEVVEIRVGRKGEEVSYTIHKKLLSETGGIFHEIASSRSETARIFALNDTDPAVFKLFVEILYSRRVPEVLPSATLAAREEMLKTLCRLYAMVDKYNLKQALRNRVMDKVQDGFLKVGRLPEPGLVKAIYQNTSPGSQLRKFCAASLVFLLRSLHYANNGNLKKLIKAYDDILEDFLEAVRKFCDNQDPRIRNCHGEFGSCLVCIHGPGHGSADGIFPCYFHIHDQNQVKIESEDASDLENTGLFPDRGCYFWPANAGENSE